MLGSALIIGGAIWPSIVPSKHSLARKISLWGYPTGRCTYRLLHLYFTFKLSLPL